MRKAQFYTFAGVVLISLVYMVITSKPSADFKAIGKTREYSRNYEYEAKIVINNAVYDGKNISEELSNFTGAYIDYGNSKDLGLGILYIFSYRSKIHIVNKLGSYAIIKDLNLRIDPGDEKELDFRNTTEISYRNNTYEFTFLGPSDIVFKSLFIEGDNYG